MIGSQMFSNAFQNANANMFKSKHICPRNKLFKMTSQLSWLVTYCGYYRRGFTLNIRKVCTSVDKDNKSFEISLSRRLKAIILKGLFFNYFRINAKCKIIFGFSSFLINKEHILMFYSNFYHWKFVKFMKCAVAINDGSINVDKNLVDIVFFKFNYIGNSPHICPRRVFSSGWLFE